MKQATIPPKELLTPGAKWYLKEIDGGPYVNASIPLAATAYTKDGKMYCLVGEKWDEFTDEMKVEILAHEAGHVAGGHDIRQGDRKAIVQDANGNQVSLWNLCGDAAIHYSGGVQEWAIKEFHGVTYDNLGIPPVPAEIAYEMLLEKIPSAESMGVGCGRLGPDGEMSPEAKSRSLVASIRGAAEIGAMGTGSHSGHGRPIPDVIPSIPDWIHEVLARLKKAVSYDDPVRRWVKETRRDVEPIMLPGRAARLGVACTFIGDASGSMSDEDLGKLFGAVEATPELAGSEFVIFSSEAMGPVPIREWRRLVAECGGGGTSFMAGAALRRPGVPVVWLTDGYTGDGWPEEHDADELWVITTSVEPPHGVRIQA